MSTTPNITELMKKAEELQKVLTEAHERLSNTEFTAESGAGIVKATCNGNHKVTKIEITNEAYAEGKEILSDLIVAAVNKAHEKAEKATQDKMRNLTQSLGIPPMFEEDK